MRSVADRREAAPPVSLIDDPVARARQVRRAWAFLSVATVIALLLCGAAGGAAYWYRGHATAPQSARVDVVQGDRAFIRGVNQKNWNAVPPAAQGPPTYLHEGESLQTGDGTHVFLTLWDGSTVDVFERSQVQVAEMRATQYISRAKTLTINQTRGLVRVSPVTLAPGDFSRSRFQVVAGPATVLMKEGSETTGGGGTFLVEVTLDPDGESIAAVRASVRRGAGVVRAAGQEVRLAADEQTIVAAGSPPSAPAVARRDLVANGAFTPAAEGAKDRFTSWRDISTPGQVDGPSGRLVPVREMIDGREVDALECSRSMDSTDAAITGLRQVLDAPVTELGALELTADVKVLDQNVAGGGVVGSEFPLIVRVNYRDETGAQKNRIWGFYVDPAPSGAIPPNPSLVKAFRVKPGEWAKLQVSLRDLTPQPVRLESIDVYASGHGYRARVTNVAIVGTE